MRPTSLLAFALIGPVAWAADQPIRFEEVARSSGVDFRFETGSRGRHDLPEIMGGGVAMIDIDVDGRIDLYFANGGPLVPDQGKSGPGGALFRNLGGGKFARVDGPPGPPYAMGCAVGDYDGDGRDDLFLSGWRGQRLYRNEPGRFVDVTDRAGVASDRWTTSSAFADLDGDGDLDLYVAAYLTYDPLEAPFVAAPDGKRDYPGPEFFPSEPDHLYRNNGDGTFTDVSASAGLPRDDGRGLGVLIADLVGDGRPDIFVANDGTPNLLLENKGGLKFVESAVASGVALDGKGDPLAGMGVALGDLDGRTTLCVTNFLGRSTIAFVEGTRGRFDDRSRELGLIPPTRVINGFGIALADLDDDGLLDLIQANGHVLDRARLGVPLAMRPLVLRRVGSKFEDVSGSAGPAFGVPIQGRGLAVGDLDDDGRLDVVLARLDGPALILRNASGVPPGLVLDLKARDRSGVGAIVRATAGGRTIVRRIVGGGSYLSASDRRVHLAFPGAKRIDRLEIRWPSGREETWTNLEPRGTRRMVEGTGQVRATQKQ